MTALLLFLILLVLLFGREAFWKGIANVAVPVAVLLHFAVFIACFGTLIYLIELVVNIGMNDLPFEQWFWKHSVFTLWLPGAALVISYILHGHREYRTFHCANIP